MNQNSKLLARDRIDKQFMAYGRVIQDNKTFNWTAATGVASHEFQTSEGQSDYVLFVNGNPVGLIEANREEEGVWSTMVEEQSTELYTAEVGDFLIPKKQIVHGASAVVPLEFAGMEISSLYIAVRVKDGDVVDINFFNWQSKTKWFYKLTYKLSYGVHIEKMTLDFDYFKRRMIMLPTIEEQKSIAEIMQTATDEVKLHEQKLAALQ